MFALAGALPFFTNIDEQSHVDLVLKYSHGHIPRGPEPIGDEAAPLLALYGSFDYLNRADSPRGPLPPAPFLLPPSEHDTVVPALARWWTSQVNREAVHPPLPYGVAGMWLALGRWIGLQRGLLLYWVRWLNVLLIAMLVWLAAARSSSCRS